MRHLVHQSFGKAQMPITPCRRIPPGQRDLTGDPAPPPGGRHTRGRIRCSPRRFQRGRRSGLTRCCRDLVRSRSAIRSISANSEQV